MSYAPVGALSNSDLTIAASTIWVVIAAVLVMFMQAGFAFLEAGLTRMKNVGHIAAKNVLILAIASIVYYFVGFGMAFGDGGNGIVGGSGFIPSIGELLSVGQSPFSWFSEIPGAAGYMFEVVFCAVSLAIVWGAMAERTKLWVYFAFGVVFTLIYSLVSHWIWSPDGWLFSKGMQDFAGSTVVHYQGALAALAGALLLGPRIGKFGADGKPNAIPGHNMAFTTLGVIILWFGWFGFNPGSTLGVDYGGLGFFAYVALNTNIAAAAGVLGAVITSWIVIKKPDLSMMLNGAVAALVAITAACAFVAPWAAMVIGLVAGVIVVLGVLLVERVAHRRPDRRDLGARHGGRLGDAVARLPRAAGAGEEPRHRPGRPLLRRRLPPARRAVPRARRGRRVHVHRLVRRPVAHEGDVRDPGGARARDGRPGRVRARHVGLPRVLHPGPGRLRDRVARPSRRGAHPRAAPRRRSLRPRPSSPPHSSRCRAVWIGGAASGPPHRSPAGLRHREGDGDRGGRVDRAGLDRRAGVLGDRGALEHRDRLDRRALDDLHDLAEARVRRVGERDGLAARIGDGVLQRLCLLRVGVAERQARA